MGLKPGTKLQEEIKQNTPFRSPKQELLLNMMRTAAVLQHRSEQQFRPYGLSSTQYNVLRILRGAERAAPGEGLVQSEIGERLVAPVPDVPRILERMEKGGWISRCKGDADRRTTIARITSCGMDLLTKIDEEMDEQLDEMFREVPEDELERFNELLMLARQ